MVFVRDRRCSSPPSLFFSMSVFLLCALLVFVGLPVGQAVLHGQHQQRGPVVFADAAVVESSSSQEEVTQEEMVEKEEQRPAAQEQLVVQSQQGQTVVAAEMEEDGFTRQSLAGRNKEEEEGC
eukprot:GHVS01012699.1.p1 GENE.GHVS01012699.1~~GHVS01012699.1.p1  ORF type:complete len:123 (+),score=43.46 GHVS01012699.1:117-485(+)